MILHRDFAWEQEKRRYMRFPVDYLVKVTFRGETIQAQLRDMSLNGVFVDTSLTVPLSGEVELRIYDDDRPAQCCELRGTVVRTTGDGFALRLEKPLLDV